MRIVARLAFSILLTVAVIWIGFYVFVFWSAYQEQPAHSTTDLMLLPVNVLLNAWPAVVLVVVAVLVARLNSRARKVPAS